MSVDGKWQISVQTPMGERAGTITFVQNESGLGGEFDGDLGVVPVKGGNVDGSTVNWQMSITNPIPLDLDFKGTLNGAEMSGTVALGPMGDAPFTANQA